MTEEQWYFHLQAIAVKMYEDFKSYLELLNAEQNKSYLFFSSMDDNSFLFKIGHNKILLSYTINLKEMELRFKTYFIKPSDHNYGSLDIKELSDFEFHVDNHKNINFITSQEEVNPVFKRTNIDRRIIDFPASYINVLKNNFKRFL